jgi:hypothetical protein
VARSSTSFKPGAEWKGNGAGRPPGGLSPTKLLREALEQEYRPGDGSGVTRLQFLIEAAVRGLVRDAEAGELSLSALQPILSRLDGSPPLGLDVDIARSRLEKQDSLREQAQQRATGAASLATMKAHAQGLF